MNSRNPFKYDVGQVAKAIYGGLLAGLTTLGTALTDGQVTGVETIGVAVATITVFGTVFGVTNTD